MGVIFDPEQIIAGYDVGEPLVEITTRPKLAEGKTPWDRFIP
jgi:hypothetical protein